MIHFTKIQWKNILSYGNNLSEFNFDSQVVVIYGKNGSGKSLILEVLTFALFGKAYRKIKTKQLLNSNNKKNLEVKLYFTKQEDEYCIQRGLKPDYFRIYKNPKDEPNKVYDDTTLIPVSSTKKGYQQILEEDILQFNENLFNQVTVKSLTKQASFMTLSASEKRHIIENLFDIEVFSVMNKLIKTKNDEIESKLKIIKKDIDNTDILIQQEESNLRQLKNIQKTLEEESNQSKLNIGKEIDSINEDIEKYNKALQTLDNIKKTRKILFDQYTETRKEYDVLEDESIDLELKINVIKEKIQIFSNACSGCPKISDMLNAEDLIEYENKHKEVQNKIKILKNKKSDELTKIETLNEKLGKESYIKSNIEINNKRIAQLQVKLNESGKELIKVDNTKLNQYTEKRNRLHSNYNKGSNLKNHYLTLKSLYSDDGIKSLIIKKYIPYINRLLNTYLTKFNADMIFNFNTDFDEVVLTKYKEDFSYFSFSEGQKKRIDLAVLFSFIQFAIQKNKKSNTNLLILDEVMSGLDNIGKQKLHEVLKDLKDKQNKCVIIINPEIEVESDNYDIMYRATLEKGFSKLEQITL